MSSILVRRLNYHRHFTADPADPGACKTEQGARQRPGLTRHNSFRVRSQCTVHLVHLMSTLKSSPAYPLRHLASILYSTSIGNNMVGSTPTREARSSRLGGKPYDRPASASSSAANTPNKVSYRASLLTVVLALILVSHRIATKSRGLTSLARWEAVLAVSSQESRATGNCERAG
jgi:hypothetical protein